jgi:hypothetical protein
MPLLMTEPNEIELKYSIKCDVLKYNTLKDVIPPEWRKTLQSMRITQEAISFGEALNLNIQNKVINIAKLTNKDLYWVFIKDKKVKPVITQNSWNDLNLTDEQWKEIFTTPAIIRNTKITAFQYKLLFNLLPCNLYLKRIKRSDTDKCNLCMELDDTAHYLVECNEVSLFWKGFNRWWNNWTNEDLKLNKQLILVGALGNKQRNKLLNACILLAKWHIYKNKLNQSETFFYKFLCDLKYYLTIEKTISLKNNRMNQYVETWHKLEESLT